MVLEDHLVVYFVLRLHELAFCLLNLQVEHVYVLRLREVPVQVLVDQFDCVVHQVAVCGKADYL